MSGDAEGLRPGIDVGGTNTDADLLDGKEVLAAVKRPTTGDVTSGIVARLSSIFAERWDGHPGDVDTLIAFRAGMVIANVLELIYIVDRDTEAPVTTEVLRYGLRVRVLGIPAQAILKTPLALESVRPRSDTPIRSYPWQIVMMEKSRNSG